MSFDRAERLAGARMTMQEPISIARQRPAVGEFIIASLPENTRAHLYGRSWDGLGYWRWSKGRNRSYKAFYRFNRFNVPVRVPESDWPEGWSPLTPIKKPGLEPVPRHSGPELADVPAALEVFNDRLITALKVHLSLPDEIRAMVRVKVYGLITCAGLGDYAPAIDTRFRPSRAQQDDSELVLTWFARLQREQQDVCWLRAKGFSIRAIAEMPKFKKGKFNATKVRTLYNRAVIDCYRRATQQQRT
ncbi:hypothetical protein DLM45_10855 [Hyphomicrobium methylovorum]|uniref:hypothetical protein n=1 Tax=Hyphomicrobium methylovorum TaxID=84 RepID=UPI0015E77DF5|nr:hypothetical protein [Hyphomicrobium methylovorum]MBA2126711.1 hypothetical protein [Hyphomicrobium methylovorum]